jgi:huntingtin-interacting protein 1-related protein
MMTLQDQIDTFQKLIFAHIPHSAHSECRISALVPLVQESYGIYKFITSMLRAMHTTLGDDEALRPLRERYDMQHYRLVKFYYECSQLRYLTSLITVPRLPSDPPNLLSEDDERPNLPSRPAKETEKPPTPPKSIPPPVDPEPISEFWKNQQAREQDAFAEEQRRLQEQWEAARRAQEEQQLAAQREFEAQQRQQAEQQRLAQEQLQREQLQQQTFGRLAELERENLNARAQWERDQLLLEQYDRKMKALETELAQMGANYQQQVSSKDDQIAALQRQLNELRQKYDRSYTLSFERNTSSCWQDLRASRRKLPPRRRRLTSARSYSESLSRRTSTLQI